MTSSDLGALLEELGIDQLRLRNGNWMGCCPVHGERRPSFGISETPPHFFGCFACSAKGTLYTLLKTHYEWDQAKIEDRIGSLEMSEYHGQFPTSVGKSLVLKYVEERRLYPFQLSDRAISYCKKRGLSELSLIHI
jgi:DNA primase